MKTEIDLPEVLGDTKDEATERLGKMFDETIAPVEIKEAIDPNVKALFSGDPELVEKKNFTANNTFLYKIADGQIGESNLFFIDEGGIRYALTKDDKFYKGEPQKLVKVEPQKPIKGKSKKPAKE